MPNDTTTLNGSLRQLGETMASNLTTQGVPSTYDEGLSTLAQKILDIQGGGVRTLTLTSDKDLLSYADSESATLTATLLEDGVGVSGETVEFFNGSTSLGTAQTDSNGVAVKTYASTGAGDVSLKAEADNGMLVSKTFVVHDKWFYSTSIPSYARTTIATGHYKDVFNTPIDLPSEFEFELEFTQSSSYNYITVMLGESSSNFYYNGFGNTKQLTMAISRNNNRDVLVNDDSHMNVVTDSVKVGYDGTQMYVSANNRTVTSNNSEFSLDKFLGLFWGEAVQYIP